MISLRAFTGFFITAVRRLPQPPHVRRMKYAAAGLCAAALLSGCSGMAALQGDADEQNFPEMSASEKRAYENSTRAARVAVNKEQPKRQRITAQQILTEWGTLPAATAERRGRQARSSFSVNALALPEPDYAISIQEMMKEATCVDCTQLPYHAEVAEAAAQHGVPAGLIHAVIRKESGYNPRATSHRKARGLMQVMPSTGKHFGVSDSQLLYDPAVNIQAGTAYLKSLMRAHDTVDEVLAAYNAGPGNVRRYRGVPPFVETRRYVRDVKKIYTNITRIKMR